MFLGIKEDVFACTSVRFPQDIFAKPHSLEIVLCTKIRKADP